MSELRDRSARLLAHRRHIDGRPCKECYKDVDNILSLVAEEIKLLEDFDEPEDGPGYCKAIRDVLALLKGE